jgi:HSP20 family molecular chaperone IbpA
VDGISNLLRRSSEATGIKGEKKMAKHNVVPQAQQRGAPVRLSVSTVGNINPQVGELSSQIARRAYERFEARGGQSGEDLGDWLQAEEELVYRVPFHSREQDNQIELELDVSQSEAQEIHLSVEPRRLLIQSEAHAPNGEADESATQKRTRILFQVIDLPFEVDVDEVTATLDQGVVTVIFPKQQGAIASIAMADGPEEEEPSSTKVADA